MPIRASSLTSYAAVAIVVAQAFCAQAQDVEYKASLICTVEEWKPALNDLVNTESYILAEKKGALGLGKELQIRISETKLFLKDGEITVVQDAQSGQAIVSDAGAIEPKFRVMEREIVITINSMQPRSFFDGYTGETITVDRYSQRFEQRFWSENRHGHGYIGKCRRQDAQAF